jgi:hypothetical protein
VSAWSWTDSISWSISSAIAARLLALSVLLPACTESSRTRCRMLETSPSELSVASSQDEAASAFWPWRSMPASCARRRTERAAPSASSEAWLMRRPVETSCWASNARDCERWMFASVAAVIMPSVILTARPSRCG